LQNPAAHPNVIDILETLLSLISSLNLAPAVIHEIEGALEDELISAKLICQCGDGNRFQSTTALRLDKHE
jgi:hypothetical protein